MNVEEMQRRGGYLCIRRTNIEDMSVLSCFLATISQTPASMDSVPSFNHDKPPTSKISESKKQHLLSTPPIHPN